jgi:ribosomal protein S27AE
MFTWFNHKCDNEVVYIYAKRCPKCGSTSFRTRWHKRNHNFSSDRHCAMSDEAQPDGEHLHYYCETCLYDWAEPIKDESNGSH